jgi:hypothetical protein
VLNLVSADAMPFLSAYIASKQGLAGLSQSLAAEVGPSGVRVIAFAPGMVDTPGMSEAARELAPRLGMSYDEFMAMTMPAPAAAAAAAYLVVRLAEEYHGAVVSGYDVLERASLTSRPESGSEPHIPPHEAPARETEDRLRAAQMALDLSQKLVSILRQTDEEALRLPAFVLPLARRGFRKKAGDSVEGWLRALSDVQGHLMQVSSIGAVAVAALRSEHTQLEDSLRRLLRYYQEAPRELARFTRDHEAIRQAEQVSAERGTVINDLIAALDKVMQ